MLLALAVAPQTASAQPCMPVDDSPESVYAGFNQPFFFPWQGNSQEDTVCFPSRQSGAQLKAYLIAPTAIDTVPDGSLPVVVVGPGSVNGIALYYKWSARELAGHGYLVIVSDPQGVGRSEIVGDCGAEGCAGVPYQNASNYVDNLRSGIDYAFTQEHPWLRKADLTRIGVAGHSLSARSAAFVGSVDTRVGAVVAWDNMAADLHGDEGTPSGEGACASLIGGELPGTTTPIEPRVPTMGQASDANGTCNVEKNTVNLLGNDPELKKAGYRDWKEAGVASMQLAFNGAAHGDWAQQRGNNAGAAARIERQLEVFQYYTRAWFDLYLYKDESARRRLLARTLALDTAEPDLSIEDSVAQMGGLSRKFRSAVFMPEVGLTQCEALIATTASTPVTEKTTACENTPPISSLTLSTQSVMAGGAVRFDVSLADANGDALRYELDFGDGSPPAVGTTSGTLEHTYRNTSTGPLVRNVTLRVVESAAGSPLNATEKTASVTVAAGLSVTLGAVYSKAADAQGRYPVSADSPLVVDFTATAAGGNGKPKRYTFVAGDGSNPLTQDSATFRHGYTAAGPINAHVLVSQDENETSARADIAFELVTSVVVEPAPVAARAVLGFSFPTGNVAPADIAFSTLGSTGTGYTLDFGDGARLSGDDAPPASISHRYHAPGTYTATLTLTGDGTPASNASTQTLTVVAQRVLTAQLVVSPTTVVAGDESTPVTLDASRTVPANGKTLDDYDFAFDFGDDFTVPAGSARSASHVYTRAGTYEPKLTVTDRVSGAASLARARLQSNPLQGSSQTVMATGDQALTVSTPAGEVRDLRAVPMPLAASADASYPLGFVSYRITGLADGARVSVTLTLPDGVRVNGYTKCAAGRCDVLPATVRGNLLSFTLEDGGVGDEDGVRNGVIADPGAPSLSAVVVQSAPFSERGGALGWEYGMLGLIGWMLRQRRKAAIALAALGFLVPALQPARAAVCEETNASPGVVVDQALGRQDPLEWHGEYLEDDGICLPSRNSGAQLRAFLLAPADIEQRADGSLPVVVIGPGSGGVARAMNYLWSGRDLASHGYLVLAVDPQGVGRSEVNGDCGADGCPGIPFQTATNYVDGMASGADYLFTREHPWLKKADLSRIGLAGHSLSARGGSWLGGSDERFSAVVAWDNMSSSQNGDAGISSGGGACGSLIGGEPPGPPIVSPPRIPTMGQASDVPGGCTQDADPEVKKTGYEHWRAAGTATMQLVFLGAAHADWTQTSSSVPEQLQLFEHYTRNWFDLYLKKDETARLRLLLPQILDYTPESIYSTSFRSAVFMPEAGLDCPDLLAEGCRAKAATPAAGVSPGRQGGGLLLGGFGALSLLTLIAMAFLRR